MNRPAATREGIWVLEVVRGHDPGRRYSLPAGESVLGAGPGASVDLSGQETAGPRRMAARQAALVSGAGGLELRDLGSPGGTFVNRQRVAGGSTRRLEVDDVVQMGGVQLRVVRALAAVARTPASPPPVPGAGGGFPFTMAGGLQCRDWDDFLRVSAQRWEDLKAELTSGRLAAFVVGAGRGDLVPDPLAPGSADDRLDDWLTRIPTSQPARPELDTHPASVVVEASGGGGVTRRMFRVSNTGHRLLRVRLAVDPPNTRWLRIEGTAAGAELVVVDEAVVELRVEAPEDLGAEPWRAAVVVRSNGGDARVEVVLQRAKAAAMPEGATGLAAEGVPEGLQEWVASQPLQARLARWPLYLALGRLVAAVVDRVVPSPNTPPGWVAPAAVTALLGGWLGWRSGRMATGGDRRFAAMAGSLGGVFAATVWVAACRALEPGGGLVVAVGTWAVIGVVVAAVSSWIAPPAGRSRT